MRVKPAVRVLVLIFGIFLVGCKQRSFNGNVKSAAKVDSSQSAFFVCDSSSPSQNKNELPTVEACADNSSGDTQLNLETQTKAVGVLFESSESALGKTVLRFQEYTQNIVVKLLRLKENANQPVQLTSTSQTQLAAMVTQSIKYSPSLTKLSQTSEGLLFKRGFWDLLQSGGKPDLKFIDSLSRTQFESLHADSKDLSRLEFNPEQFASFQDSVLKLFESGEKNTKAKMKDWFRGADKIRYQVLEDQSLKLTFEYKNGAFFTYAPFENREGVLSSIAIRFTKEGKMSEYHLQQIKPTNNNVREVEGKVENLDQIASQIRFL